MIDVTAIQRRYLALSLHLDERARRIFAAPEANTAGYGGIAAVSRATGIAASTIGRGLAELSDTEPLAPERVRRPGGGDKKLAAMGHKIGRSAVSDLLHQEKFSLQANRKTREGEATPTATPSSCTSTRACETRWRRVSR